MKSDVWLQNYDMSDEGYEEMENVHGSGLNDFEGESMFMGLEVLDSNAFKVQKNNKGQSVDVINLRINKEEAAKAKAATAPLRSGDDLVNAVAAAIRMRGIQWNLVELKGKPPYIVSDLEESQVLDILEKIEEMKELRIQQTQKTWWTLASSRLLES